MNRYSDSFYVSFLNNIPLSEQNQQSIKEGQQYVQDLVFDEVQMLEAMLVAKIYPRVCVPLGTPLSEDITVFTFEEEDVIQLLNSHNEEMAIVSKDFELYTRARRHRAQRAIERLMQQFILYINGGPSLFKQNLPHSKSPIKKQV